MYGYLEKAKYRTTYLVCRHLSKNGRKEKYTHIYFLDKHVNYLWQDTQRSDNNWLLSLGGRLFDVHTFHTCGLCDGITYAKNKYNFKLKETKVMVGELNTNGIL